MDNNHHLFVNLCKTFESIKTSKQRQKKVEIFVTFLNYFDRRMHYEVLRLFLVKLERERGPYNLRETTFTKTIKNMLCLAPKGQDMHYLANFRATKNSNSIDYADAAFAVLKKKLSNVESKLSVSEINCKLDEVAAKAGNDIRGQETLIFNLLKSISNIEQKWLIRLLLKDLKLGLSQKDILSSYHKDANKYMLVNCNLRQLCEDLFDPNLDYSNIAVSLFKVFRPMLSLRCDVKEFNKTVSGDREFFVENKFDGERFQLHYSRGQFKFFSRNGYDYTENFKELSKELSFNANSLILDGEVMIWNKRTRTFGSKGMAVDIKKVKADNINQQCFCAFDLVYLNGKVLTNYPLKERSKLLASVVIPQEGVIQISRHESLRTKQEIIDALNLSMDKKEEGIVFKCPLSKYLPDERNGWWKVKLEYFEGVMSDLDVLIIGAYYGIPKSELNSFLLAVKNNEKDEYLSFAKIGTGLGKDELKMLEASLGKFWLKVKGKEHESAGIFWGKDVPDVWIKPENSCCLQVRGSELIKIFGSNPDFKTSYTLRFPRILKIRSDKPYDSCMTVSELAKLTGSSQSIEKLNKRHLELSDIEIVTVANKRRKKSARNSLPQNVEEKSKILESREFLVLSGQGAWTKELIELAVLENGGKIVLAIDEEVSYCMLMGDDHIRATTYRGNVDIVKVDWLRRVLNEGEFLSYTPFDVIYMSDKSDKKFKRSYDMFGDSYLFPATKQSITYILDNKFTDEFLKDNYINFIDTEVKEFYQEIGLDKVYQRSLLGYIAYFDHFKIINNSSSAKMSKLDFLHEVDFKFKGGQVSKTLNAECDCIIASRSRFEEIQFYLNSVPLDVPIFENVQQFMSHLTQNNCNKS